MLVDALMVQALSFRVHESSPILFPIRLLLQLRTEYSLGSLPSRAWTIWSWIQPAPVISGVRDRMSGVHLVVCAVQSSSNMLSARWGKAICAPPRLSEFSPKVLDISNTCLTYDTFSSFQGRSSSAVSLISLSSRRSVV